jgi:hypothetical protein
VSADPDELAEDLDAVRLDLAEGFASAHTKIDEHDRRLATSEAIARELVQDLAELRGRTEERARDGDASRTHSTTLARLQERVELVERERKRERAAISAELADLRKKVASLQAQPRKEKRVTTTAIAGGAAGGVVGIISLITWLAQLLEPLFKK